MKPLNAIASVFKRILLSLLEKVLSNKEMGLDEFAPERINRIVIIRTHDHLEDLLLSTPVFRAIRRSYPQAYLSVLTKSQMAPFLKHNVNIDEVICLSEGLSRWSVSKAFRLFKELRSYYDLAIVLNTVSHSLASDLLAYLTGAKFILGSEHLIFPGCKRNFFYNLTAPYSDLNKHETERSLDILRHIGVDTEELHEEINLTREEKDPQYLNQFGLKPSDFILAIYLSSDERRNSFAITEIVQIAKYFSSKFNARILASWEPQDRHLAHEFVSGLPFRPVEATGLSLKEHLSLLYFCDLVICHDNILMHLAASVGTPLIAIFEQSDPYHRKPIGSQFMALKGEEDADTTVTAEQIISMAQPLCEHYPKSLRLRAQGFDISERVLEDYLSTLSTFE